MLHRSKPEPEAKAPKGQIGRCIIERFRDGKWHTEEPIKTRTSMISTAGWH